MLTSILKTLISYVITLVIAISNVGAAAETPGSPSWDGGIYTGKVKQLNTIQRIFTFGLSPAPPMEITCDEVMTGLFDEIKAKSGFDFQQVASNFPDIYHYVRWLYYLMPKQFNKWRDQLIAKGDQYELQGDGAKKGQYRMMGSMIGMPKKAHIKGVPFNNQEGVYEIHIEMVYGDGSKAVLDTSSLYNTNTGEIGEEWGGVAGIGYNFNVKKMYAYTTADPFQRALGYMKLYDSLLLTTTKMVNIKTIRLKFKYDGKEWMMQLWKGRYFITSAGEVGLYNRPLDRLVEFYNAVPDEERVRMSFKLTAEGVEQPLVDRAQQEHWWMTGFALNKNMYLSEQLTLNTNVTAPSEDFRDGLVGALQQQQKSHKDLLYKVDGNTIKIAWGPSAAVAVTDSMPIDTLEELPETP